MTLGKVLACPGVSFGRFGISSRGESTHKNQLVGRVAGDYFHEFSIGCVNHSFLPASVGLKLDAHFLRGFPVLIGHCSGRFPFSDGIRILGGPAAACEVDQTANDQSKGNSSNVFLHSQLRLGGKPHRLPRNDAVHNDNSLVMAILLHILVTSRFSRAFMPELQKRHRA